MGVLTVITNVTVTKISNWLQHLWWLSCNSAHSTMRGFQFKFDQTLFPFHIPGIYLLISEYLIIIIISYMAVTGTVKWHICTL